MSFRFQQHLAFNAMLLDLRSTHISASPSGAPTPMASTEPQAPKKRLFNTMKVTAFVAGAAGIGMLLLAQLEPQSLVTASAATLNKFGWVALAVGVVLLVLHWLIKPAVHPTGESTETARASRRRRKATAAGAAGAGTPASAGTATQGSGAAAVAGEPSPRPETWNPEVLDAIEWRRFEAVCEALFAQPGFAIQSQSHGENGGVDIWLYSRGVEGSVTIVRCKRWRGKAVDVRELQKFLGEVGLHQLKRGSYVTTSAFTPAARQFAEANGIRALDGADLFKMISARSPEEQQALLREAFDGDYWRPMCANCGVKMVERTASEGGVRFWGCSTYPHCKLRLPMVDKLRQLSLLVE